MEYAARWEALADALTRVRATTGLTEEAAQTDLCRALADGTIKIRCKLKQHATRPMTAKMTLDHRAFLIPPELKPTDIDWEKSRPLGSWFVLPGHFKTSGLWHLEHIELNVSDLTSTFPAKGRQQARQSLDRQPARRSSPDRDRAGRAIEAIFLGRKSDQAGVSNKRLCALVNDHLKKAGLPEVSEDTVLRAAGRRN